MQKYISEIAKVLLFLTIIIFIPAFFGTNHLYRWGFLMCLVLWLIIGSILFFSWLFSKINEDSTIAKVEEILTRISAITSIITLILLVIYIYVIDSNLKIEHKSFYYARIFGVLSIILFVAICIIDWLDRKLNGYDYKRLNSYEYEYRGEIYQYEIEQWSGSTTNLIDGRINSTRLGSGVKDGAVIRFDNGKVYGASQWEKLVDEGGDIYNS